MAVDATPSILLTPSDGPLAKGDVSFDGGFFAGVALLRDPSVAMGYQGTLGFRSINGGERVWSFTSRHMLGITGIDRRPQPFFWKVAMGGHLVRLVPRVLLAGGEDGQATLLRCMTSASARLGSLRHNFG